MDKKIKIPNHIGIIMDGNGRWAQERGLVRIRGHQKAVGTAKELCVYMASLGVNYASLYAFSTENFKRSKEEVDFLMNLFVNTFKKEFSFVHKKKVKVIFSGRREPLPKKVLKAMDDLEESTKDYEGLVLNICLNYGSHAEIIDMTKKLCTMYKDGEIELADLTLQFLQKNMYQDLPPLDFVIRTSGEMRLSNFMMFQASYAEFYFPKVYFPDFNKKEFDKALEVFNRRDRRFGGIK